MSELKDISESKQFNVKVGLAECTVSCTDKKEAIRLARKEINNQLPNMWSVIEGIKDKEFRVDQIG